jgi:hypothetical protein
MGDDSHFVCRQKLLGGDESVRRGVVMVKQRDLFSPKFMATSSHVSTQSPQNFAVKPEINRLACLDWCFALPQLLYRWRHQYRIFWIPPSTTVSTWGIGKRPKEISVSVLEIEDGTSDTTLFF